MALNAKFAFHLSAFGIDAFTTYYDLVHVQDSRKSFGGKLKYLTVWCIILQTAYFGLSVIVDLIEQRATSANSSQRNGLKKFRDLFHSTVAFPIATFVAVTFWALYAVDRELVFPKILDGVFPTWLNHALHTVIIPFTLLDKILVHHKYPRRMYGIVMSCALSLVYLLWILLIAYVDDFWVYPVLQHMSSNQRIIFIAVCLVFFASFYILGEALTMFIWGTKRKPVKAQK